MLMDATNVLKMALWHPDYNHRDSAVQRLAAAMHWLGEGVRYGSNEARNAAIDEARTAYTRDYLGDWA